MGLVSPEVLAGPPRAGLHLVTGEEDVVAVQDLVHRPEEPVGRDDETADALNGFGDHGCDVAGGHHVDGLDQVGHAGLGVGLVVEAPERTAQPVAALDEVERCRWLRCPRW